MGTIVFRKQSRISLNFLIGGISVVLLGFLLNSTVLKVAGHPEGTSQSNFSYVLYGLAVGGKGWQQVRIDHPRSKAGSEYYQLAFEAIWTNPANLVKGLLNTSLRYFNPTNSRSAFSFISGSRSELIDLLARICLYFLSLWGFLRCYCQRHDFYNSLIFAATLGVLLSVPILADGGIRVYAATIPISAILIMLGIVQGMTSISKIFRRRKLATISKDVSTSKPLIIFGSTLAVLTVLGPIIIYIVSESPKFVRSPCSSGQETIYVRMTKGSSITVLSNKSGMTNISMDDLT
ncbi:membrane protein [Beggiatoa sp. PS]|nr:membrane protein [Beggiatoa sp. PS]